MQNIRLGKAVVSMFRIVAIKMNVMAHGSTSLWLYRSVVVFFFLSLNETFQYACWK